MPTVYIDTCVLFLAFKAKEDDVSMRAIAELDREDAEYLFSSIIELECLPKPTKFRQEEEVKFFTEFFAAATRVPCLDDAQTKALEIGCDHGMNAPDALHVGCAITAGADEFVTAEKPAAVLGKLHNTAIEGTTFRTISAE